MREWRVYRDGEKVDGGGDGGRERSWISSGTKRIRKGYEKDKVDMD